MLVNDEFSFITNNYFPNTIKWEKEERGNKFPFLVINDINPNESSCRVDKVFGNTRWTLERG